MNKSSNGGAYEGTANQWHGSIVSYRHQHVPQRTVTWSFEDTINAGNIHVHRGWKLTATVKEKKLTRRGEKNYRDGC